MADKTPIEWTDATWNPIVGCSVVSPGCTNCYAMRTAARLERMMPPERRGEAQLPHHYTALTQPSKAGPVWTGRVNIAPEHILTAPLHWRRPRRIFVNSMSDLFHEAVSDEWIDRVFAVMALSPQHTFQVLTKRPERMRAYLSHIYAEFHASPDNLNERFGEHCVQLSGDPCAAGWFEDHVNWPLPNVWLGVSVEDQRRADERVDILRETPAAVRWVSAEPMLGPIIFRPEQIRSLDWVVAGGESGPNARPMHPDWARSLRDQCAATAVPFLFKQWGEFGTAFFLTTTGQPAFRRFETFEQWRNKAQWARQGICLDALGRRCSIGSDFMRARDEGAFPVTIMHQIGKKAAGRLLDGVLHTMPIREAPVPDWPFGDLPRQHFACILIDPPWEWSGGKKGRPQHYPRMRDREIAALPIKDLCDPAGAWVFVWITSPGLIRALNVISAWKLRYSGRAFVWCKTQRSDGDATPMWVYPSKTHMGMGFTTRKNAEDVLLFRIGKPVRLSKSVREVIFTGPREHSRKPTEAFARIEEFCPGPRLELFAREPRPGWASWGTETQKFVSTPEVAA